MKLYLVLALSLVLLAGCVSVPNPFVRNKADYANVPADSIKAVAMDIERAVQEGNREPQIQNRDDLAVNADQIMQAIRMRAARSSLLNEFLDAGFGREENNGLIKVLDSKEYKKATTGKQRSRDALLVYNENNDRWTIFESLVKLNKLSGGMGAVQNAFHEARVQVMKPGQKYQEANGETVAKN